MLTVGWILAAYFVLAMRDVAFGLVFVWAFSGIAVEQAGVVQQGSLFFTLLLAAVILFTYGSNRYTPGKTFSRPLKNTMRRSFFLKTIYRQPALQNSCFAGASHLYVLFPLPKRLRTE